MKPIDRPIPTAEEARRSIEEIDRIVDLTRKTIAYGSAAPLMIVWGVIWLVGFIASQWNFGLRHRVLWAVLALVGFALSIGLRLRHRQTPVKSARISRIIQSWLLLLLFALLWTLLLSAVARPAGADGSFSEQQTRAFVAFWCTIPLLAYAVMGLWLGRFYLWLGLAVTGVIATGFFCAPGYLYLIMGLFGGGSLIAAGTYSLRYWK